MGRGHHVGRHRPPRPVRPAAVLHCARRSPPPAPCWTGFWPRTKTPAFPSSRSSTGAWPNVVAMGSATRTCLKIRRHGASPSPRSTRRLSRLRTVLRATGAPRATRHHRRGAAVQRKRGMDCRPPASSHCGCGTPAAPSTPTHGPGTRSASAARPIRVATSTWLWAHASPGRSQSATRRTRSHGSKRAEAAKKRHADGMSSTDAQQAPRTE